MPEVRSSSWLWNQEIRWGSEAKEDQEQTNSKGQGSEEVSGWWLQPRTVVLFYFLSIWLNWPSILGKRQSRQYTMREKELIRHKQPLVWSYIQHHRVRNHSQSFILTDQAKPGLEVSCGEVRKYADRSPKENSKFIPQTSSLNWLLLSICTVPALSQQSRDIC